MTLKTLKKKDPLDKIFCTKKDKCTCCGSYTKDWRVVCRICSKAKINNSYNYGIKILENKTRKKGIKWVKELIKFFNITGEDLVK